MSGCAKPPPLEDLSCMDSECIYYEVLIRKKECVGVAKPPPLENLSCLAGEISLNDLLGGLPWGKRYFCLMALAY